MSRQIRYIYNEQTQAFEVDRLSARATVYKSMAVLLGGISCFLVYFFVFIQARGNASPKELLLQRDNRALAEQIGMLEGRIETQDAVLLDLSLRDNLVYRPVFGMEEIPAEERNAGLGGAERYDVFLGLDHAELMADAARQVDGLTRKAYVQTLSFDEVRIYSSRAGDMASCIPSIYPVNPKTVTITSPFGARFHPVRQAIIFHEGVDLAGPAGQPVYATGDGVVESTQINFSGYGNVIVIDHGFGYKTRYAHLKEIKVTAGQVVIRGDKIGTLGNSGLSTGPHLHYEVIYRGTQINPWNYLNPDISPEEYNKQARNG
ncbi:MAG: M23 family metallopeptidase [Bacteroidales bacterium]|nr:M23 family metallopeptidase [Bacteroidales bacterium]